MYVAPTNNDPLGPVFDIDHILIRANFTFILPLIQFVTVARQQAKIEWNLVIFVTVNGRTNNFLLRLIEIISELAGRMF